MAGKRGKGKRQMSQPTWAGARPSPEFLAKTAQLSGDVTPIIVDSPPDERISDMVARLVDEGFGEPEDRETQQMWYTLAVMAWNLSLLPVTRRRHDLPELLASFGPLRGPMIDIVDGLVALKLEMFPQCRRMILNFELLPGGGDLQVNVVSSVEPVPEVVHRGLLGLE